MTRGKVTIPDLALEGNLTREQVRDCIYDLIGKDLSAATSTGKGRVGLCRGGSDQGRHLSNCGGHLELAGKGLVRCPYCGTETYLSAPGATRTSGATRSRLLRTAGWAGCFGTGAARRPAPTG